MASLLVRCLLVLVCGFAALSSSVAAALGLEEERILAFTGLVSALLLLAVHGPAPAGPAERSPSPAGPPGRRHPADRSRRAVSIPSTPRSSLPVLVLVAAPNLARFMSAEELVRFVWRLLSFYVAATFFYQVVAEPAAVARGYEGIVRYDPTGSVVMHSSLSLIHLVLAATRLGRGLAPRARLATLVLGGMSLAMVFLTATRTAFLTLAIFAAARACHRAAPDGRRSSAGHGAARPHRGLRCVDAADRRQLLAAADRRSGRFQLGTLVIHRPLAGPGRRPSFRHGPGGGARAAGRRTAGARRYVTAGMAAQRVRAALRGGRPAGLLFVVLLLALLVHRAIRAARGCARSGAARPDPGDRRRPRGRGLPAESAERGLSRDRAHPDPVPRRGGARQQQEAQPRDEAKPLAHPATSR